MPAITIDGTEYDTDLMTDEAKAQLASIQFVDQKIETLKNEIAVMSTARQAYAKTLGDLLKAGKDA
jgi:hypothetical protein